MRRAVALLASFLLVVVGKSSILSLRSVPSPFVLVLLSSEAGKSSFDAFLAGNGCGSRLVYRGGGERSRNRLLCALRRFCASSSPSEAFSESLFVTERPGEALRLRCRRLGNSNKVIARELGVSPKTVEKHRSNLMRKLQLHNAAAITMFAIRNGMTGSAPLSAPLSGRSGSRIESLSSLHSLASVG